MTPTELAARIERDMASIPMQPYCSPEEWRVIIAALRAAVPAGSVVVPLELLRTTFEHAVNMMQQLHGYEEEVALPQYLSELHDLLSARPKEGT